MWKAETLVTGSTQQVLSKWILGVLLFRYRAKEKKSKQREAQQESES